MQKSERNQIHEGDYLSLSYFYSTFAVSFEKEARTERREDV